MNPAPAERRSPARRSRPSVGLGLLLALGIALGIGSVAGRAAADHCPDVPPDVDSDDDGWCDAAYLADPPDNCPIAANPNQYNAPQIPADQCGNVCDVDYDQDGVAGIQDFSLFAQAFGSATNPVFDCTDTDPGLFGLVNLEDFMCFLTRFATDPCP